MRIQHSLLAWMILILCVPNNSLGIQGKQQTGGTTQEFIRGSDAEAIVRLCKAAEKADTAISEQELANYSYCSGYIAATLDFDKVEANANRRFCAPDHASNSQLAKVIVKYGDDHPEQLHYPAISVVAFALRKAFPCGT